MVSVAKVCKDILIEQPFYGLFLLRINKVIVPRDDKKIPTAAIGPSGLFFTLYINEGFWETLDSDTAKKIIYHECLHLCLGHLTEWFKAESHYNMNVACDCVVNQICGLTGDGYVTLKSLSDTLEKELEPNRGSWYYYREIEEFTKKHPERCIPEVGNHSMWPEDLSESEQKLYEQQLKSHLKDVADEVEKIAGRIPGELSEIIKALKDKPPVFNWKSYFRRVVGNSISSEIRLTKTRPSKRFPDARGTKLKFKPNICVIVDTSGSVSKKNLSEFFGEINHICKTGIEVTVIECDTKIQKIFKYTGKETITVNGRGGTILSEAFNYYNQHKEFSSCVVFTDGYLCDKDIPSIHNSIWIITSNGNKSLRVPGKLIFIP